MTSAKIVLFVLLGVDAAAFAAVWIAGLSFGRKPRIPTPLHVLIGVATNFFDTLGIGSYATTTSLYRLRRVVADEDIPGTLNVGHALPTVTQAFVYIAILDVDISHRNSASRSKAVICHQFPPMHSETESPFTQSTGCHANETS